MTRRAADRRTREIQAAERLAVRLHVEATLQGDLARKTGNGPDEKLWWVVRQAAAEAVDVLRTARDAPGRRPPEPAPAAAPEPERDHQGVPKKE